MLETVSGGAGNGQHDTTTSNKGIQVVREGRVGVLQVAHVADKMDFRIAWALITG